MRVANQDELGARASVVEVGHRLDDGIDARNHGVGVADAATLCLTTAGWVVDGLGSCAWMSVDDEIHHCGRRTVSRRSCGLSSTKDVDSGTLALLEVHRGGCCQESLA